MAKNTKRDDGRYEKKITIGRDPETGKSIRESVYGDTIAELNAKVSELKRDIEDGLRYDKITYGKYANKWLKLNSPGHELKTVDMYKIVINKYTVSMHDLPLRELQKSDLQSIINENIEHVRTCQQIRSVTNMIIESAIDDRYLNYNPFRKVELPKKKKSSKRPLTEQENYLLEVTDLTDRERMYALLVRYHGLRKEETLPLQKEDFHFGKKMSLDIHKKMVFEHNQPTIYEWTKSNSGYRESPISSNCVSFFKYYLSNLSSSHLFTSIRSGQLITEQSYKKMMESIIKKLNKKAKELGMDQVIGLTSHIFRHNYCTELLDSGVSVKATQVLMGHASCQLTLDVYAHIEDKKKKQEFVKYEEYIKNSKKISD